MGEFLILSADDLRSDYVTQLNDKKDFGFSRQFK